MLLLVAIAAAPSPAGAQVPEAGQKIVTLGPQDGDAATGEDVNLHLVGGLAIGVPIYDGDFADPFVLATTGGRYAYATNTTDAHIPVMRQVGAQGEAQYLGDALPTLPAWTEPGLQWAPAVWAAPDGTFVLYYSTRDTASSRQCISRGTSTSPAGPFVDDSTAAMICPVDRGGAIDPSIVDEGGAPTLLWKSDGNCCNLPTRIYSQQLSADGLSTAADPVELVHDTEDWEDGVVEGPSMTRDGDHWFLFYSANRWNTADYAIGVARCESLKGPCTKADDLPWMSSTTFARGPGGQEFFPGPGGVWMVYHGWPRGNAPKGQRRLYLDVLAFHGDDLPTRRAAQFQPSSWFRSPLSITFAVIIVVGGVAGVVLWRRRRARAADDQDEAVVRSV